MKTLIKENIIKNILVVLFSFLVLFFTAKPIYEIQAAQINDFLLIISILLVTVCFANFAFSYEKSKLKSVKERFFSHLTTFVFLLLLLLLLLENLVIAVGAVYPTLKEMLFFLSFLLYFGNVLFDFWDIERAN